MTQLADNFRFLRALVGHPRNIGALLPSGPQLSRAMAEQIKGQSFENGGAVLELGPGTGVITQAILHRIAPTRLTAIEYDPAFAASLKARFPAMTVIQGDAFDLDRALGIRPPFAAILSGLPLLNFPVAERHALVNGALARLAPGGAFVQFSYGVHSPVTPPAGHSVAQAGICLGQHPAGAGLGLPEELMTATVDSLQQQGFALLRSVADKFEIETLTALFRDGDLARAERRGETFGARNLLVLPEVAQTAARLAVLLTPMLGERCQAVRGIFFDKTVGANWPVLWHQDLSLAVKAQHDLPGWSNWSVKRGVLHVQAPAAVLERMVTVRLHLDDCPAENGALEVLPGSHRQGRLGRDAINGAVAHGDVEIIAASSGDALLMRPLLLHASAPALVPNHRRVLHLEFAPAGLLPGGLEWAQAA